MVYLVHIHNSQSSVYNLVNSRVSRNSVIVVYVARNIVYLNNLFVIIIHYQLDLYQ